MSKITQTSPGFKFNYVVCDWFVSEACLARYYMNITCTLEASVDSHSDICSTLDSDPEESAAISLQGHLKLTDIYKYILIKFLLTLIC